MNASLDGDDDSYDTTAPGEPVESNDVFYDQLEPYGVWVDEPDVGRVFIPDTENYVPYTNGHWQYTNLGFVWVSNEPHAWATSHYGRWAYSNNYNRWYWAPDTQWGPSWVEWRQTGSDFGWAPLAPEVVIRAGWRPPVETWHYCPSERILDVNVGRYYEPRDRVVVIHREARPIEHYSRVSNVRVVVGPGRNVLREHRVVARPVRVEARTVGRWNAGEAHAQVVRANEHRAVFEANNQRRIESNTRIHTAHVRVIENHPQIREQVNVRVNTRVQGGGRVEPRHEVGGRVEVERREPERREVERREPERREVERREPERREVGGRVEVERREPERREPERREVERREPDRREPARVETNRPAERREPDRRE
ncbi:MAG TPA: DUF6600 domain-containing protein, partial [Kofleriaceae bacterium]|nr:DUF6600 domain-containing protein [Kofleriaceae bacterium]